MLPSQQDSAGFEVWLLAAMDHGDAKTGAFERGERRRSSRYRVEAPAELSWLTLENENTASGWVLELDREWAYVATSAAVSEGTEVHVFVILPPFGELHRILKIGFDATVWRVDIRGENLQQRGLAMKISHLVLMGDEDLVESSGEDSSRADVPATGSQRQGGLDFEW